MMTMGEIFQKTIKDLEDCEYSFCASDSFSLSSDDIHAKLLGEMKMSRTPRENIRDYLVPFLQDEFKYFRYKRIFGDRGIWITLFQVEYQDISKPVNFRTNEDLLVLVEFDNNHYFSYSFLHREDYPEKFFREMNKKFSNSKHRFNEIDMTVMAYLEE